MSDITKCENANVTVEMERKPHCMIEMKIQVTPLASKAAHAKAVKRIRQMVSIPGFRTGKAPEAVIKSSFASQIEAEWAETMERTAVNEACRLLDLFPRENGPALKFGSKQLSLTEPSQLTVTFEAPPMLPEIDFKDISCPYAPPKEVTEEDLSQRIDEFRMLAANWNDVTGRGVQEGDYLDLDIHDADDPELIFCKDQRFAYAKDKMPEWLYNPLLGHVVGDTVHVTSEKGENDPEDFKPTRCIAEIKAIKSAVLPELDEEFVKQFSGLPSVELFKKFVKETLEMAAKKEADDKFAMDVEDYLVDKYPFEVSKSLTESERGKQAYIVLHNLKTEGVPAHALEATLLQRLGVMDIERLLKKSILLEVISQQENIRVTQEELAKALPPRESEGEKDYQREVFRVYQNLLRSKIGAAVREATAM